MIKKVHHHLRQHKGTYGKYIIIAAISLALLVFLLSGGRLRDTPNIVPVKQIEKGALKIFTKDNRRSYSINENVDIIVSADSNGQSIVGYDVILTYDATKLQFQKSESLDTNFNMFTFVKIGKVSLTGVKRVKPTISTVMSHIPLSKLNFKAIAAGSTSIQIDFIENSTTDSNLMNGKNKDILGSVENMDLVISK